VRKTKIEIPGGDGSTAEDFQAMHVLVRFDGRCMDELLKGMRPGQLDVAVKLRNCEIVKKLATEK
jgi:hypothetical protein